jgi:hypothetical protein
MSRRPQDFGDRRPRGIKEVNEAREKAEAERRRTLDRFKEHHSAVDRERLAREVVLATKRGRFTARRSANQRPHLSASSAFVRA